MNMKIRVLLPLLFSLLVVFGVGQGVLALFAINTIDTQVGNISKRLDRTVQIGEMEGSFSDVRRQFTLILAAQTPEEARPLVQAAKDAAQRKQAQFDAYDRTITLPKTRALFDQVKTAIAEYESAGNKVIDLKLAGDNAEAKRVTTEEMTPTGAKAASLMAQMIAMNVELGNAAETEAKGSAKSAFISTSIALVLVAAIAIIATLLSFFRIARPIEDITRSMNALASGDTASEIPHGARKDEIGDMAAAVAVFRQNALERERLEQEAEESRDASEQRRIAREEQKAQEAADVQFAVDGLADGLRHLADGDMTFRLNTPFVGQLDGVRLNYNETVEKLQTVLRSVGENARMIDAGANEIRSATEDLSKRTEQQAASVEETAAALEQVTTAVKDSAVKAGEAGELVTQTRAGAERSGEVVRKAVVAMEEIEKSSTEISSIIGVIDDIAFQTNLLALNAGVEAARAGEAGKGFAVVAQEVRELAQRSASAAREIKTLITKSGEQVRDGVELVGETGRALQSIVSEVQEINRNVTAIVGSAKEQSTGLSEINSAVNQMDQGTQQNASMVEETSAATHSLAAQAASLMALLGQFKLEDGAQIRAVSSQGHRASETAKPSPARALGQRLASAFTSKGSAAVAVSQDSWTEF